MGGEEARDDIHALIITIRLCVANHEPLLLVALGLPLAAVGDAEHGLTGVNTDAPRNGGNADTAAEVDDLGILGLGDPGEDD